MHATSAEPTPRDLSTPPLTARAVATGMTLGAILSACNIYTGLTIGWGTNMSITAIVVSHALWLAARRASGGRVAPWTILENNVNQAAASAAANVSSAGLVAGIPALTILTGRRLGWAELAAWVFSVCAVGVVAAVALRRQMIEVDRLPFPAGIACAETLREMYARGAEAVARLRAMMAAGVVAAAVKVLRELGVTAPLALPGASGGVGLGQLGFTLDATLLFPAIGGLIGLRGGVSLLFGAAVGWGILSPRLLAAGAVRSPAFQDAVEWLLWPGVTLMVVSSLASVAFSWRSFLATFRPRRGPAGAALPPEAGDVSRRAFLVALAGALVLSAALQHALFGIGWVLAVLAVLLSAVLALVAGRVSGETNTTPVGPMGKVTQLTFGILSPADPVTNLMAANVTGGAASQCADLLHDLKTGWLIGASPRAQAVGQIAGAAAGALAGSAFYLLLVPDPVRQLGTPEWPAPAMITWKAVAQLFLKGFGALPPGAGAATLVAVALGVLLPVLERRFVGARPFLPSASAVGLALVVPASASLAMFAGAVAATIVGRAAPAWSARFLVSVLAGLIAGESLTGVGIAIQRIAGR